MIDELQDFITTLRRFRPTANEKRYFIVMVIGVLMNQLLFSLVCLFNLPIWLDVSGTALVAFLLEPTAGLIVGLINNFYLSIFVYGSNSLLYYSISAAVALLVGIRLRGKDGKFLPRRIPSTMALVFIVSTLLATLLTLWRSGGIPTGNWETMFYQYALGWRFPNVLACMFGTAVVKFFDTIAVTGVVALFYLLLPAKLKYPPKGLSL